MALLASIPPSAVQMDLTLMDLSRVPLPFLSTFDADDYRPRSWDESSFDAPRAFLKRELCWEKQQRAAVPRKRKRVFSYETDQEMETYKGQVRTPADAIVLFEACRLGLLPRVQRRLSEKERQSIKSGSVFVWDEREAGMRRWTDGKSWSASRVSGSFLTYREMEGKRGGGQGNVYPPAAATPSTTTPSGVTPRSNGGRTPESGGGGNTSDVELQQDEGPDGYRYKPDGLMKQSFSITTSLGNHLHLISYYSRSNPTTQQLPNPSNDPSLRHIRPAKGMYPESTVHEHQNIPAVTRSPMASGAPYTVPQMANYARPGPPGPPQWPSPQPNGHGGWHHHHQPPPNSQYPPQPPYSYQYPPQNGYYASGPPPPPPAPPASSNNTQPSSQYPQQPPHPQQQSPATQNPYDDRRQPPTPTTQPIDPNLSSYDSAHQPPASASEDRQAPPPLQHPQEHVYGHGPIEGSAHESTSREPYNSQPRYDPRLYPPPHPAGGQDRPPPPLPPPPPAHHSQPTTPSHGHYPPQHPHGYYNYPPQGPPSHYGQPPPPPPPSSSAPYPHHPHYPPHPSAAHNPPPQHYQPGPPPPPHHHPQAQPPPQTPTQEQQKQQQRQQQQSHHPQPPPNNSPYAGPPPSNLHIDPALTGPYSSHQQPYSATHSRTSTPNAPKPEAPPSSHDTRGTTQASTIPSIGALMNGSLADQNGHNSPSHSSAGNSNPNGNGTHFAAATAPGGSEPISADRSPDVAGGGGGGMQKKEGPQDIGADKVGFSEDRRALKVLDKGFR